MAVAIFAYCMIFSGMYSVAIGIWWDQGRAIDERLFGNFRRWLSRQSDANRMAYRFGIWVRRQWWGRYLTCSGGFASICIGVILLV